MFTVPMGPDRLALIRDYVERAGAFVMAGGWNSFQGLNGIPGYHGTLIEEILPVQIQASDDRVETPQGIRPKVLSKDHPCSRHALMSGRLFLGYNRVDAKAGRRGRWQRAGADPFIAVRPLRERKDDGIHLGSCQSTGERISYHGKDTGGSGTMRCSGSRQGNKTALSMQGMNSLKGGVE